MDHKKMRKLRLTFKGGFCLIFSVGIIGLCAYLSETFMLPTDELYKSNLTVLQMIIDIESYFKFFNFGEILLFNNPFSSVVYLVGHLLILLIIYLIFIPEVSKILKEKKTYEIDNTYGSHGTAEWAKEEIVTTIYKGNDKVGWFVGATEKSVFEFEKSTEDEKYLYHSVNNKLNMQMIVCGPPGSNKTTGFVLPNLLHIPKAYLNNNLDLPDVICIDPKPELTPLLYKYYEELGYDIKILDYIDLEIGDTINNLYYLDKEKDILTFAGNYVNTFMGGSGKQSGGDSFFPDSAKNLLAAIVGYVLQKYPFDKQNMLGVLEVLQSEKVHNIDLAKNFFEEEGLEGSALFCWNNFLAAGNSPETYSSILVTLATNMSLFAFKEVQKLSKDNTCNIKLFGKKISSQEECEEAFRKRKEAEDDYETIKEQLENEIIAHANKVIDSIELLLDLSIIDRKDYMNIIEQRTYQIEQEQIALMELESNDNIKPNSKRMKEILNRQDQIMKTADLIRQFTQKKEDVKEILNSKEKELNKIKKEAENLKQKPIILFIWVSDDDPSLQPLVNITTNTILRQLYSNARNFKGNKLESPVYFIFEEFNNIGKLHDIEVKLGTMRSKRIFPMIIIQSLAQLKDKYKDEWENILSQCDTKIYLGINDNFTADYVSTTLGTQTIRVYSSTDNMLGEITEHCQTMQEQFHARKLQEANELIKMDNDKLIVIPRGLDPLLVYKCQFEYWKNGWEENMAIDIKDLKKIGE